MDRHPAYSGEMFNRYVHEADKSVVSQMQKKYWKTKQALIKATGKKEDEHVVASDADLDAKLEIYRTIQTSCMELLKVIEKYLQRLNCLSQEENELGMFLKGHSEQDKTPAGKMMNATSKALCGSAKQRLALRVPLHRLGQEVETFRRQAVSDTLLTVNRMEHSRTEYRGALLWMKDVSQELDPDTYKQLEKFRKVQAQVRNTKMQFDKLKNDVCQKVDLLGASRCNLLSQSLAAYQSTLLHFWERTACMMSQIHDCFKGYQPYKFSALKSLQDPFDHLTKEDLIKSNEKEKECISNQVDKLVLLDEDEEPEASEGKQSEVPVNTASQDPTQLSALEPSGNKMDFYESLPKDLLGDMLENDDLERQELTFLNDLLNHNPSAAGDFSHEWQSTFESSGLSPRTTMEGADVKAAEAPAGFLPSQLFDLSHNTAGAFIGWTDPPKLQPVPHPLPQEPEPKVPAHPFQNLPKVPSKADKNTPDKSIWFNLFADLDPLSNPDAIGRTDEELLNA
ncbi:islet cell autoantigen 1-like protein isoform X2 [Leucoraja erinacea]|uniref:islet cell autoantigen 1-like protein isoform X2 n=1 Tax=Leucoraja erinaceus TaxID=7782 RepID=UPI002454BD95|nr:islet cell autoantigen 1-like protein isoform X2 [Leucoraja erinacea]XP_055494211.1 islet cell autoantigen 1-like protein isoform X2 [Leucoraja erinacea]